MLLLEGEEKIIGFRYSKYKHVQLWWSGGGGFKVKYEVNLIKYLYR